MSVIDDRIHTVTVGYVIINLNNVYARRQCNIILRRPYYIYYKHLYTAVYRARLDR